ncbi:MAG: alanine--tRNA ligase [Bifidobacteriaceae bacterium]|jgi:alanyl-tRNA synthetase|nr:alanine--tRNA ligase [Bifidobacteriaceae bacterium]
MRTSEIRRRYLDYFSSRGHHVQPSASLVSQDPSLLFTVAGMVPFIPYMLGEVPAPWPRATSVQKCVRTLDIEEVGKTTRHGTFFQMNGNFSFGDYFKEQAITYAWELVTGPQSDGFYGFDPDKIWVTVFKDDDEAAALWRKIAGLPEEHIQRRGMKDNFWSTGQPGPAGPCSEIYIDRGPKYGKDGGPEADEDRFLEIWNLVFMQYERGAGGEKKEGFPILGELKQKNIDTGMGLERVAFLLQDVDNLYEIDEVFPVIAKAQELSGRKYGADHGDDVRMRVVADHVRSALMLIGDGVTPSNMGRGYVLRRLLRRAIYSMRLLGVQEATLPELLTVSKDAMKASYPSLEAEWDRISGTAYAEEETFLRTLTQGTTILDTATARVKKEGGHVLPGKDAFQLHDTYGFPIDLTLEIAEEQGLTVDQEAFRTLMTEQRERARADAKAKKTGHADTGVYQTLAADLGHGTEFLGYTDLAARGRVVGLLQDGKPVAAVTAPADIEVILDRTPFYGESGGQLADQGAIEFDSGAVFEVDDVQKPIKELWVHRGRLTDGTLTVGEPGYARIDQGRRHAIARAHTATHMVHKALREELGETATQAGSENAPNHMRFDFRYGSAVSDTALQEIEGRVNSQLIEDLDVTSQEMPIAEARAAGAMALFGEKYGDVVRVISIGDDWSRELCGGTHVRTTGEIGRVALLGEGSIGSGVRRVEALVGDGAYGFQAREHALVGQLGTLLKVGPDELPSKIESMVQRLKEAERELAKVKLAKLMAGAGAAADAAKRVGKVKLASVDAGEVASADDVRTFAMDVRNRLGDAEPAVVAVAGQLGERAVIVVAANQGARDAGVKAGALVKNASKVLGGGGGGKDDIAQGGGQDATKIAEALGGLERELAA